MSIKCPECESTMRCHNSRPTKHGSHPAVRRRQVCPDCDYRMTTIELGEGVLTALIERKNDLARAFRVASEHLAADESEA